MTLSSPSFSDRGAIPKRHTADGEDCSPELVWSGLPKDAKALALIMDDPDAPGGTWVHWVLYDLPPSAGKLSAALPKNESLANGAHQGACWGVDRFERVGYHGPCPPPGKPHRYVFRLYALSAALGLGPRATKDRALKAMEGKVLAQAELVGMYGR
jgi:Raf kinase inhibitor-like YbhB/YbcL family protein